MIVIWIPAALALAVIAVTFFARLLTHHTVLQYPEWERPIRTTDHTTRRNDRTQPRRAAR